MPASLVSRWSLWCSSCTSGNGRRLRTSDEWTRSRFLQVAAGISLLLLALHEFVDYNLYTPANQLVFAVLAGIFFMPVEKLHAADSQRRRKRNTSDLESPSMPSPARTRKLRRIKSRIRFVPHRWRSITMSNAEEGGGQQPRRPAAPGAPPESEN
jgi:hypothetical protein